MIQIHQVEQGSDEWKALRVGKFTGSNAYKLLGNLGVHEYAKAVEDSFAGNFWTKRGHLLEDEAIELYEVIRSVVVERAGVVTNDKYPNCLYSPDGLAPVPLLEVKCFDIPHHMELIRGDIPLKILAQIHYGLLITERPYAELIAYNPSDELATKDQFKIITIKRNPSVANNFKRILKQGVPHAGGHATSTRNTATV